MSTLRNNYALFKTRLILKFMIEFRSSILLNLDLVELRNTNVRTSRVQYFSIGYSSFYKHSVKNLFKKGKGPISLEKNVEW